MKKSILLVITALAIVGISAAPERMAIEQLMELKVSEKLPEGFQVSAYSDKPALRIANNFGRTVTIISGLAVGSLLMKSGIRGISGLTMSPDGLLAQIRDPQEEELSAPKTRLKNVLKIAIGAAVFAISIADIRNL